MLEDFMSEICENIVKNSLKLWHEHTYVNFGFRGASLIFYVYNVLDKSFEN